MTGAVSGTTTYTYDANGNETGITNPNTTTVTKGYDNANRLSSVTNKNSSGTVLSSYTITPNADSQVTGISESGGSAVTYGYDALGHLTSDVRTGTNAYSKSYTVDGEGNRTDTPLSAGRCDKLRRPGFNPWSQPRAHECNNAVSDQKAAEGVGVADGVACTVIVEISEHIPASRLPFADAIRPPAQIIVGV